MGCGASADGGYDGTTDGPERFKMGRALGDGFSCQVYQATDKKTKQKVAAKFLNKDSDALDTEELFKKEAQVLQLVFFFILNGALSLGPSARTVSFDLAGKA